MADYTLFKQKAPGIMSQLMKDFDLIDVQAAGILGNLGHECAGFQHLHELGQPENRGGYGWAQWTGPRRVTFFDWCREHQLDWESDEANYGFLKHELETSERRTIPAVSKASNLADAVRAFERNYERAGVVNYKSRIRWGQIALSAFQGDTPEEPPDTTVGERYRVVARSGLILREGPGKQFERVASLYRGQIVFVVSISDGWARVDVEGDGYIDGFASAGYLEPV